MIVIERHRAVRKEIRCTAGQLLDQLGETPNAVALSLASYGIRGIPRRGTDCALSRYLQLFLGLEPAVRGVEVDHRAVRVTVGRWVPSVKVELPSSLRVFVAAFDTGCYLGLVEGPGRSIQATTTA